MRFAILGPLRAHDGETLVDVPKGRQRALLEALLLHAGKPVPAHVSTSPFPTGFSPAAAPATLVCADKPRAGYAPGASPSAVTWM